MPPRKTTPATKTETKATKPKATSASAPAKVDPKSKSEPRSAETKTKTSPGPVPDSDIPRPSRAFADLDLSEPWMPLWIEVAVSTGSAEDACAAVGVTLGDFAEARRRDPGFDELCRVHDQIVDLRITEKLRTQAIAGDVRSQALYYNRVRELVLPEGCGRAAEAMLSATIAEAMISAALAAGASASTLRPPALLGPTRPSRAGGSEPGEL